MKNPEKIKFEKLNLGNINNSLKAKDCIEDELFKKIDRVRQLRNEQHIGIHKEIKDYTKADLEFVFSVAKEVKKLFT